MDCNGSPIFLLLRWFKPEHQAHEASHVKPQHGNSMIWCSGALVELSLLSSWKAESYFNFHSHLSSPITNPQNGLPNFYKMDVPHTGIWSCFHIRVMLGASAGISKLGGWMRLGISYWPCLCPSYLLGTQDCNVNVLNQLQNGRAPSHPQTFPWYPDTTILLLVQEIYVAISGAKLHGSVGGDCGGCLGNRLDHGKPTLQSLPTMWI